MSSDKIIDEVIVPPNETPTIENQEKWEIIALPEKQCKEPIKYSPENLNNLLARTRKQYNDYILEILTNFELINKEIETDIRLKSNVLKDELSLLKQSGANNVEKLALIRTKIFSFEEKHFSNSKIFCENLLEQGKVLIDEFLEGLNYLEKYRSDKFKQILKEYYEKMEKCSCKAPYEIQIFFEEQILHINQMLLTNLRNSKELHFDLMEIYTNDIKLLMYNITKYEEEWKDICKTEIIKRLREYITDEEINEFFKKYQDRSMTEIILLFNEYEAFLLELLRNDPIEIAWYNETKNVIDDLGNTVTRLVVLYENAADKLSNNSAPEISDDRLTFLLTRSIDYSNEFDNYIVATEFGQEEEEEEEEEIFTNEKLEMLWKNTLRELLQFLHMKYVLLNDLKDLWEKHDNRVENLKTVILKDLELLIVKNDKSLQGKQEMALNIAIDSLRQELNEKKMIKSMKKITKLLNKMTQTMTAHKEAELKLILKYMEYTNNESNIFTTVINQFTNKYAEEANVLTLKKELRIKNLVLFTELQKCTEQIKEINMWKFKIIEQIIQRMETFPVKQVEAAHLWMVEHINKVKKKFENQLELHNMRYDRIQKEIYDVRLAEIQKHQERFDSHKTGAENRLVEIQQEVLEFEERQGQEIQEFLTKLKEMAEASKNCKTSLLAQICLDESNRLLTKSTNRFTETVKNYVEHVLEEINQILTSNYNFLQHIKLFHEGGNYNPKEAAAFSKKLLQFDIVIQKRFSVLKNGILATEKKLLKTVDQTSVECTEKTTMTYTTLKFKEEDEITIGKVQGDIKSEVYQMKYKKKKIDTINERIKQLTNTNDFSNVESVIKYCTELINHFNEYKEYLEDLDTPSTIYSTLNVPVSLPATPKSKSSKKSATSKKSKKEKPQPPVFTFFKLFEYFNSEKVNKYMPTVCQILQETYLKTQTLAQDFYSNLFQIENIELPQSYNEYISVTLPRYKYYYLQCLQAWAEAIEDFTLATKTFLEFATQYCSKYLQWLHDTQFDIFKEKQRLFSNNAENVITINIAEIKNVHNMLKPLYGYHRNHKMLLDLKTKMDDVLKLARNSFDVAVEPFEEQLNESFKEYMTTMAAGNELVDHFKSLLYDDTFCKKLNSQAISVIKSTYYEDFDIQLEGIISYTDEDLKTNSEEVLTYIIENVEEYYSELRTQIVQEEVRLSQEEMSKKKSNFSDKLASMLKTWLIDTNKVTDLYTVKYE